jgi:predicted nucleic acid-binding Zn ribbon protein
MARSAKRTRGAPTPAAQLVSAVLRRYGVESAVREHRIVTEWEAIVGDRVAARAWPDGLKNGVLYVRVTNSGWLQELGFLREALVRAANQAVGAPLVREIRLHLGARPGGVGDDLVAALAAQRRPRGRPRSARPAPSSATLARIDRETAAVGDDELRAVLRDVRRRLGL